NDATLWKSEFKRDLTKVIFFAEDIFGIQFCIKDDEVCTFDPETSESKVIATSLADWARWILEDPRIRTGWPLAHFWQLRNGPLESGIRLLPKVPFVLGGQFAIENLSQAHDIEAMRYRASIANQLLDCPDGSKVILKIRHPE